MSNLSSRRPTVTTATLCAAFLALAGCSPNENGGLLAMESEDESPEPVAVTVFTDKVELFMEYPRLVPGQEARFLAHVTVLSTGEPVRSGQLQLELSRDGVVSRVLEAERPTRDGLFIPVAVFDSPGEFEARILVQSDQVVETIPLAPLVVHPDLASAFAAAEAEAVDEPADAVPFLLEQAWKINLLLEQVERRTLTEHLQVPGEVAAAQGRMAAISAPLDGRLVPADSGKLPHLGDRVEQGQVLAYLAPPLTTSDRVALAANATNTHTIEMELLVREYDLQAKSLEIEQAILQAQTRLDFARLTLKRIEGLRADDLGTVAELEAARRDVELAQQETEGSRSLKESFSSSLTRLNSLRSRSAASRAKLTTTADLRQPLIAPIAGEVVKVTSIEGEHVEALDEVYRVLDSSRVWITAHVPEFNLASVGKSPGAQLIVSAFPERRFDVLGELGGSFVHFGTLIDPETRTVPLRYEVPNPEGLLRAGMFADVFIETDRALETVCLPEKAIVMDNGRPIAFVLIHGELYQKRVLELGIHDGGLVEVRSGVQAGERVVTQGAYLVKLAAASPDAFGAGHAH